METQQISRHPAHTQTFLKERKFMVIIPLLILPFLTMAFWALGGGKKNIYALNASTASGLNTTLPQAQFKDQKAADKMSVYQAAQKDSSGRAGDGVSESFMQAMGMHKFRQKPDSVAASPGIPPSEANVNEAKIQAKLAQINQQIKEPQAAEPTTAPEEQHSSADLKRLHKMMRTMNNSHADPEMRQLSKMLDKIQAIQNPPSVAPKAEKVSTAKPFKAMPAMVDGKQKVKDGATVKLKLTEAAIIKGITVPKGQLLYGACQIVNQRLLLTIKNIRNGENIIPVDLTVFSQDGMPGIPAPEAELAGSVGTGADNAIQSMQFLTMDASIGAQAAAGGVNAAKSLFSKKVKKIKVKLKDEFPVLLRDNNKRFAAGN